MASGRLKLGVDIGASKIHIIVWDGKKVTARWRSRVVTPKALKEAVNRFNINPVGIGVPGILDFKTGRILKCPNLLCFNGLNLKRLLKKEVRVDNDAKCFLRAERKLGAAKGYKWALGLTFGTGIGGAIFPDFPGADGSAGEFGHMVIERGRTWEKLYQKSKTEPRAQEKIHAIAIANLINIFNPQIIILGGGGAVRVKKPLIEKFIVSPLAKRARIVSSRLGDDAVALGAALLFEEKQF